jgi:protein ImuB
MLWLALHFRHLPLEVFTRGTRESQLVAITSSTEPGAIIVDANRAAQSRGVHPCMSVSAACALSSGLRTITRDATKEHTTLKRIAAWGLQYTPLVSVAEPADILLEIEGSLKLFGGLGKLHARISRALNELGFDAAIACAPTPRAAQLFAHAGLSVRIQHHDALKQTLAPLPAALLCTDNATRTLLESFGVCTFGECLELPRDGLARRAGQRLLDDLDRALGLLPDPRVPFTPPRTWDVTLPLPAPVEHAEALLFAARRLLIELCGWLAATGQGTQCLQFEFTHDKQASTCIALELATASRDADHLLSVLRERLARVELPCAATEISIACKRLAPVASHNLSFLPDASGHSGDASHLIERLNARLGTKAVCSIAPWPDYRPERAWRSCPPEARSTRNVLNAGEIPYAPPRPLWLLTIPRPLREIAAQPHDDGPLSLIAGPERIEAGWWDGQSVARDYFVARDTAQSLLWIYRERNSTARWYMHGFFS